jgi:hypothetical protein
VVRPGELLGDDHPPGVDDELAGLGRVKLREVGVDLVKRISDADGSWNLHGSLATSAAHSSRENAKPITRNVEGKRHVDDLLDPKLQPPWT